MSIKLLFYALVTLLYSIDPTVVLLITATVSGRAPGDLTLVSAHMILIVHPQSLLHANIYLPG